MLELFTLVQKLAACCGPAGYESEICRVIEDISRPFADECYTDAMGNLIVHRRGEGPRIMFAAHMDTIGLVVTHIEPSGFLRIGKLGGVRTADICHTGVRFANGVRGVVAANEDTDPTKAKLDEFYIDIGASDKEEAVQHVRIGDAAVFDAPACEMGSRIVAPGLDNRISCAVLLMAMERICESGNDLYFVFTCQEELGARGAKTAAYGINPDYALAVDVTLSDDQPEAMHNGSSVLGGGAAIKIMDNSVISHPKVVSILEQIALARKIPCQKDVIRAGGTDAGTIHTSRVGVYTGGVSIPCRYIHSPTEMVEKKDVLACVELVSAFAQEDLPKECDKYVP